MSTPECSVDGCEKKPHARGWCNMHYKRWRETGDPERVSVIKTTSPEVSFAARTEWRGDCLIWMGAKDSDGYGHISVNGKSTTKAHRYSWEQVHGPIPSGMVVDHMLHCDKACVNVRHLRLATAAENSANRAGPDVDGSSGHRNVYRHHKKWRVQIKARGKVYQFGVFDDIDIAAEVAGRERARLFGEFAGRDAVRNMEGATV